MSKSCSSKRIGFRAFVIWGISSFMVHESKPFALSNEDVLLDLLKASQATLQSERDKASGWVAGAFAAFNAAGFGVALSNVDRIENARLIIIVFGAGLLLSFITAVLYAIAKHNQLEANSKFIYQLEVPVSKRESAAFLKAAADFRSIDSYMNAPLYLGVATVLIALLGSLLFITHFRTVDSANKARCLAIQKDMLTSTPLRSDGPDLFQALGCRPQGEGSVYARPRPTVESHV